MLKIYHNPRCSKSRQTLAILREHGYEPEIIEYLKTPLSSTQINSLLEKLGFSSARQALRTGEAEYKALELKNIDDEVQLISAMVSDPKLIERPIVETQDAARIGRPPESVLGIVGR